MISEEEWDKLKANELYGMYARLFARVNTLEARLNEHLLSEKKY